MAGILKSLIRPHDTLARIGGDEFSIILPQTDLATATKLAQDICSTLGNHSYQYSQHQLSQSVSIGIGLYSGTGDSIEPHELVGMADKYLYEAKESGRNQVRGPGS